jgi:hypothetical protein
VIQLGLTQLAIWAFGRAVLTIFSFAVFALYERKNDKHMIGTYHAAAGENAALCCGMQQLRKSYQYPKGLKSAGF